MATGTIGQPAYTSAGGVAVEESPAAEGMPRSNPSPAEGDASRGAERPELVEPAPPTDHDLLMELVQRYEVLGNAVVKLSEKVADPARATLTQGAPAAAGPSGVDMMGRLIDVAMKALGGNSGGSSLFQELYVKAHENYDTRVLLPTFSNLARGELKHVASGHVG